MTRPNGAVITMTYDVNGRIKGVGSLFLTGQTRLATNLACTVALTWPLVSPRDGVAQGHRPPARSELESLRLSVQRGRPFGEEAWVRRMAKRFDMESTWRPRGRPKVS